MLKRLSPKKIKELAHPNDWKFFLCLRRTGLLAARKFILPVWKIEPKRRPNMEHAQGIAYVDQGLIAMVLRGRYPHDYENVILRMQWSAKPLSEAYVWGVLAHELAHFGGYHFSDRGRGALLNHGMELAALSGDIEEWIKDRGHEVKPCPAY